MINPLQSVAVFGISDVLREQADLHRVVHALATADGEELEQRHVPRVDGAISMALVRRNVRNARKRRSVVIKSWLGVDSRGPPGDRSGGYHINRYI
ncbi:MAG: hypothetical protein HQL60_00660 [Magnetococcales bacterium]|nr:hypothetical protein [Magnetococcales bacterium]